METTKFAANALMEILSKLDRLLAGTSTQMNATRLAANTIENRRRYTLRYAYRRRADVLCFLLMSAVDHSPASVPVGVLFRVLAVVECSLHLGATRDVSKCSGTEVSEAGENARVLQSGKIVRSPSWLSY